MLRTVRQTFLVAAILLTGVWCAAAETTLPKSVEDAVAAYDQVVSDARHAILKALDEQIDAVSKTGNLTEVKALQSDKDNFEKHGIFPKSARLKTAVTKSRGQMKAAYEKTKNGLEAAVKEQTKAKEFETAERVQKALDSHVRTWGDVVSGTRSSIGAPKSGTTSGAAVASSNAGGGTGIPGAKTGAAPGAGAGPGVGLVPIAGAGLAGGGGPKNGPSKTVPADTLFAVTSATWGYNEIHKQGLPRQDVTAQFAKMLASGNEVTINEATFGALPSNVSPFKALNVDLQAERQTLRLWLNNGTKIRMGIAQRSNAEEWDGGPIQLVSSTWSLEDGSQGSDSMARLKDLLKTKGRAIVGYHEFGEIQFGKGKVMQLQLQAKQVVLGFRVAESTRIEIISQK